jgi:hypothetical protein
MAKVTAAGAKRHAELVAQINAADRDYYVADAPRMPDAAYDALRRDLEQRGRTFQSVREQYYRTVRPMHLAFVEPSKRWADLIIPEGDTRVALDIVASKLRAVIQDAIAAE